MGKRCDPDPGRSWNRKMGVDMIKIHCIYIGTLEILKIKMKLLGDWLSLYGINWPGFPGPKQSPCLSLLAYASTSAIF